MTVDSEAIFALAEASDGLPASLEELRGSMATAWLDERQPGRVYLARGVGRPLWIGAGREELFFASTKAALEVVEQYLRLKLRKREVGEGTLVTAAEGRQIERDEVPPEPRLRGAGAPGSPGSAGGSLLPPAPRSARDALALRGGSATDSLGPTGHFRRFSREDVRRRPPRRPTRAAARG